MKNASEQIKKKMKHWESTVPEFRVIDYGHIASSISTSNLHQLLTRVTLHLLLLLLFLFLFFSLRQDFHFEGTS